MKQAIFVIVIFVFSIVLSGCSTTNSIPYKASTDNILTIRHSLQSKGKTVRLGSVTSATGVNEYPTCRLMGPVNVEAGKSLSEYIEDAFKEELFLADVYDSKASTVINGRIEAVTFSSISPAHWDITMSVNSNTSNGYSVSLQYPFKTSFDAISACRNVAAAFGPTVQELLEQVVNHPQFASLAD